MKRHIYLTGFMGCGKSTVGHELALVLQCPFVDLDQAIVERAGKSIPEIFSDSGEGGFRQLESECLLALARMKPAVVATGGGILGRSENREFMQRSGAIVYLNAEWETLKARIGDPAGRPLARDEDDWSATRALWLARRPVYEQADVIIPTDHRSVREIVDAITPYVE